MMFYRRETDGTQKLVPLEDQFAGPVPTGCWIIGGGPSLSKMEIEKIARSPAAKFSINLAGTGLLRPDFWTSYDPTVRFHRSIYLDASIIKFVHSSRSMDLVPETTFKVCDSPALYLIDRDPQRGFHNFPGHGTSPITDWQDSLIQAIDIAYRLGFRELYLAGCEMRIWPSSQLLKAVEKRGIHLRNGELLGDFVKRCETAGITRDEIEALSATTSQYHFAEQKSLTAAIQTDFHYFRVAQSLRLARRSMALAGLQIFSVTPGSRLNDIFPQLSVEQVCARIQTVTGDPASEQTLGRYSTQQERRPHRLGPMRDVRPHFWTTSKPAAPAAPERKRQDKPETSSPHSQKFNRIIEELAEVPINLNEEA